MRATKKHFRANPRFDEGVDEQPHPNQDEDQPMLLKEAPEEELVCRLARKIFSGSYNFSHKTRARILLWAKQLKAKNLKVALVPASTAWAQRKLSQGS